MVKTKEKIDLEIQELNVEIGALQNKIYFLKKLHNKNTFKKTNEQAKKIIGKVFCTKFPMGVVKYAVVIKLMKEWEENIPIILIRSITIYPFGNVYGDFIKCVDEEMKYERFRMAWLSVEKNTESSKQNLEKHLNDAYKSCLDFK